MKVLLGVDNDNVLDSVLGTLRWCVRLRPGDEVAVAHVAHSHSWAPFVASWDPAWRDMARVEEGWAEWTLSEARRCLAAWGVAAEFLSLEGPSAAELLRVASC